MFKRAGATIKIIAIILSLIGCAAAVVYGLQVIRVNPIAESPVGILTIVSGCLGALFGGLLLFGYGVIVQTNVQRKELLEDLYYEVHELRRYTQAKDAAEDMEEGKS